LLDPRGRYRPQGGILTTGLRCAGLGWSGATDDPSLLADPAEPATMVDQAEKTGPGLPQPDHALRSAEAQHQGEAHLAEAEQEVDERKRGLGKAARIRDGCRREVADLELQLDYAHEEAQEAGHRVADAEEALALAEQPLRAAQVRLHNKKSCLND